MGVTYPVWQALSLSAKFDLSRLFLAGVFYCVRKEIGLGILSLNSGINLCSQSIEIQFFQFIQFDFLFSVIEIKVCLHVQPTLRRPSKYFRYPDGHVRAQITLPIDKPIECRTCDIQSSGNFAS